MCAVKRLLVVALLLASCGSETAGTGGAAQGGGAAVPLDEAAWAKLEARPLQITPLAAGASCPISDSAMLTGSATGLAFGAGPVYAVPGGPTIVLGTKAPDASYTVKVLWLASPDYKGGALIRGARLDAAGEVTFADGAKSLRFGLDTGTTVGDATQGSALGWRYLRSEVRLPADGCYGFQIDLPDRTIAVTLRAAA